MPPYLFVENDFPPHVTAWSLSFLENRTQFVRLRNCSSAIMKLEAGCPQGTFSGPNNFKLLINDLLLVILTLNMSTTFHSSQFQLNLIIICYNWL